MRGAMTRSTSITKTLSGIPPWPVHHTQLGEMPMTTHTHTSRRAAFYRDFGLRLRLVREALGLTEQQATDGAGVTVRTYRRWEAGHKGKSSGPVFKFGEKFRVNLDWLFGSVYAPDCAGLSPTQAIRKMTGTVAH
jgi:DNA-binding XRE family transcriptional regulator